MKKAFAIFLLMAMLFNAFGVYGIFSVQRYYVQQEVKQALINNLDETQLTAITVTKANSPVEWVEPHEFRYEGEMYDVVRTEETDSTVTYYSFNDEAEDELFDTLKEETDDRMKEKHRTLRMMAFAPGYLHNNHAYKVLLSSHIRLFNYQQTTYPQPSMALATPPPKA